MPEMQRALLLSCFVVILFGAQLYAIGALTAVRPSVRKLLAFVKAGSIHRCINGYKKKKNIYFANSKNNYNTNIMCKHRGGFPEGQSIAHRAGHPLQ